MKPQIKHAQHPLDFDIEGSRRMFVCWDTSCVQVTWWTLTVSGNLTQVYGLKCWLLNLTKWCSFRSYLLPLASFISSLPGHRSIHLILSHFFIFNDGTFEQPVNGGASVLMQSVFFWLLFQMSSVLKGADAQTNGSCSLFARRTLSAAAEKSGQNIIWWPRMPRFSSPCLQNQHCRSRMAELPQLSPPHR